MSPSTSAARQDAARRGADKAAAGAVDIKAIEGSSFGVEIYDVDLSRDISDATIKALLDALYEHRVIVIKNQDLDEEAYLTFGRKTGTPDPHPVDHLRLAGFPEIEAVGNSQERDKDEAVRNGAAFWHTDQCYEANPASAIMLYALKVPKTGGETLIADMRGAYDDLDQAMKDRIDRLIVRHCYSSTGGRYGDTKAPPIKTQDQQDRLPTVRHPLVLRHPATARKSLYAVAGFTTGIDGMADHEAAALLQSLKSRALSPKHVYSRNHTVGDITIIDQFQTLHSAVPIGLASGDEDARLLWRIGIKNAPGVLKDTWRLGATP